MSPRDVFPHKDDIVIGPTCPPLPYPVFRLTPQDQEYHATIRGRTGSGKSRLLESLFSVFTASRVFARSTGDCASHSSSTRPSLIPATKRPSSAAGPCSSGLPCGPSRSVIFRRWYHHKSTLSMVDPVRCRSIAIALLTAIQDTGVT